MVITFGLDELEALMRIQVTQLLLIHLGVFIAPVTLMVLQTLILMLVFII